MAELKEVANYLNTLLSPELFHDYCPNGLQVEGKSQINKLITGVSADQALLIAAVEENADAILVHHGYFWKGEDPCVVGIKRHRLAILLAHNMNLFTYHLPLDAHAEYGNNAVLSDILEIKCVGEFGIHAGQAIARTGVLRKPMSGKEFSALIKKRLSREPLHIPGKAKVIKSIAWCTGAAQDLLLEAADLKVDAFLTGEISERTFSLAKETGIHFYAAGHHATERYGVKKLGEHLALRFGLEHHFIDTKNPI